MTTALLVAFVSVTVAQQATSTKSGSLAAWKTVQAVLQHPRCINCHQAVSPLQGDTRRTHIPHVVRGEKSHGVSAMKCGNCHNDSGNNPTSRAPGGKDWHLAPVSMLWEGLSGGALCRSIKDRAKNGKRNLKQIVEHMETEPLVLYGWDPGAGREAVPISHAEFVNATKAWVDGGAACPAQ